MAKTRPMSESHLHAVVAAVADAGSEQLARRAASGAAVPFELVETPAADGGAPMFSYRPLTLEFVEEHLSELRTLEAWSTAVNVLAGFDGLGDYLRARGEKHVDVDARERAERALVVLLATMHAETGDFLVTPERTAGATDALARTVLGGRVESVVVVPLLGVRLETPRLELEDGLSLMRDDIIEGLPRSARAGLRGRPGTLAVIVSLGEPSTSAAVAAARPRLLALLRALRLFDRPAPALAPMAWARTRGGGWASHPFVGTYARAAGVLELAAEDAEGLAGFLRLVAEQPLQGPAAWAARRHELACERSDPGEALTDVMLALRALLPERPGGATLAGQVADLCAPPDERAALAARVEAAEAMELAVVEATPLDRQRLASITEELRWHLRSLLRDIVCGHLPADLDDVDPSSATHRAVEPVAEVAQAAAAAVQPEPAAADEPAAEPAPAPLAPMEPASAELEVQAPLAAAASPVLDEPAPAAPAFDPQATVAAAPVFDEVEAEPAQSQPAADEAFEDPIIAAVNDDLPIDITDTRPGTSPQEREFLPDGTPFEAAFIRSLTEGPGAQLQAEQAAPRGARGRVSVRRVRRRGR